MTYVWWESIASFWDIQPNPQNLLLFSCGHTSKWWWGHSIEMTMTSLLTFSQVSSLSWNSQLRRRCHFVLLPSFLGLVYQGCKVWKGCKSCKSDFQVLNKCPWHVSMRGLICVILWKHLNILVLWRLQRLQKVAKSDFQALKVSRLREVQRWRSGLQKLQSPNLNI